MRKLLLTFSILLTIILSVPLAGWYFFPQYAQNLANHIFKGYLSIEELTIQRPSWNKLVIDHALARLPAGEQVTINELQLGFNRRFSHFSIALSYLQVDLSQATRKQNKSEGTLSAYLPSNMLQGLPEIDATIKHFACKHGGTEALWADKLRLSLTTDALDINGDVKTQWQNQSLQGYIQLTINKQNTLIALLKTTQQTPPEISLTASLDQLQDLISADIALHLQRLDQLQPLIQNMLPEAFRDLQATIKSDLHISMPDQSLDKLLASQGFSASGNISSSLKSEVHQLSAAIEAAYKISGNGQQLDIEVTMAKDQNNLIAIKTRKDSSEYQFTLNTETPFSFEAGAEIKLDKSSVLQGKAYINGSKFLELSASQPELTLADNNDNVDFHSNLLINANISNALGELPELQLPAAKGAQLHLPLRVLLNTDTITLAIASAGKFSADNIEDSFGRLQQVSVTFPPQEISFSFAEFLPRELHMAFEAEALSAESYTLTPLAMEAILKRSENRFVFELKNRKLTLELPDAEQHFDLPPYTLIAETAPFAPGSTAEDIFKQLKLRLLNQCGELLSGGELKELSQLNLSTAREFNQLNTFSNWLDMQFANDIVNGELLFTLDWNFTSSSSPWLNLNLANAYANGELGTFDKVQLLFSNRDAKSPEQYAIDAKIESLNVGVAATDLNAKLQLDTSDKVQLDIMHFAASLFGGTASVDRQSWQLGVDSEIVLNIENMNLAYLVQSQGIEGLTTEGSLSGEIPLHLSEQGEFSIRKGTLINTRDGVISYHNVLSEDAGIDEKLKLTLEALQNFHYQQLSTETHYQNGKLILRSKILGSNPDMSDRKVDLNLNTEVGLLASLQAMRLQQGLEARIEEFFGRTAGTEQTAYCKTPY